jgi:hypothetical protein
MKRLILVGIIVLVAQHAAVAYTSSIAIQTDKNSTMQVSVNGRLCNPSAKSFVRIKGNAGLYHVSLKVFNPHDKVWYIVRKDVHVVKGYEFFYKVNFTKGKRPVLLLVKRYPVYSNYFLNPALYNKHAVT